MSGLGGVLSKLQELAETGATFSKTGEIPGAVEGEGRSKGIRGVYGFSVKVGLGDHGGKRSFKVEPFGDLRAAVEGLPPSEQTREPLTDVFQEDDRTVVVAELPGIEAKDLDLQLNDDILVINARRGEKRYRKEILFERTFRAEDMTFAVTNGVLEITLKKGASP
ncbi:MAG: Hsp20/alpha crystallin family protein [Candidatus Rokubacteria bacterium]|nr:Hsp20/alpha crystallin family protein [Candidatus Rokubacteria bacterium]